MRRRKKYASVWYFFCIARTCIDRRVEAPAESSGSGERNNGRHESTRASVRFAPYAVCVCQFCGTHWPKTKIVMSRSRTSRLRMISRLISATAERERNDGDSDLRSPNGGDWRRADDREHAFSVRANAHARRWHNRSHSCTQAAQQSADRMHARDKHTFTYPLSHLLKRKRKTEQRAFAHSERRAHTAPAAPLYARHSESLATNFV